MHGAKHGHRHGAGAPRAPIQVAVLTVSDTRTEETDHSGALARRAIVDAGHAVFDHRIVPDEQEAVRAVVTSWLAADSCEAVIVTGGTGVSSRDRTYEAISRLLEIDLPGFGELFRALSFQKIGAVAMMSRATAGIARGRPVFSIPGSPDAVELAITTLILPELPHLLGEIQKHTPVRRR
jgi:molybdenum cofactor biosynthesis protein B